MNDEIEQDEAAIRDLRAKYGMGPFIAADAVVVSKDNKVLLIRRGNRPNRGTLAFPGGRVEVGQRIFDAVFAELLQETKILVNGKPVEKDDLELWCEGYGCFDEPDRDPRAHWITMVHLFYVPYNAADIQVEAADDAQAGSAAFYDPDTLVGETFFADHEKILVYFLFDQDVDYDQIPSLVDAIANRDED